MEPPGPLRAANERRAVKGAASQVALARAALRVATDPGVITVLRARVKHEDETLAQIAARFGMTKDAYWSRLRRALADAKTSTRPPREDPEPQPAAIHAGPSPRSANAIRIGMGRRRMLRD